MKKNKIIISIFILIGIISIVLFVFLKKENKEQVAPQPEYSVVATDTPAAFMPSQKVAADDKTSVKYKNASDDLVKVSYPLILGVTNREFEIKGKARGQWFFESSARVKILNNTGKPIYEGTVTATGDALTKDYVPFIGKVKVPEGYSGMATLVLLNDNPSGLPENESTVSFPIILK